MRVWSHLSEGAEDATHPESPTLYGGGAELRSQKERCGRTKSGRMQSNEHTFEMAKILKNMFF